MTVLSSHFLWDLLLFGIFIPFLLSVVLFWFVNCHIRKLLNNFFAKRPDFPQEIKDRFFSVLRSMSILFPIALCGDCVWIKTTQNQVMLGKYVILIGILMTTANLLLFFQTGRLLHLFGKGYEKIQGNRQRPIRGLLVLGYILLIVLAITFLVSFAAKERPMVFLSSVGAITALFIFAFKHLITSIIVRMQINTEKIIEVGDWVEIEGKNANGIVEMISTCLIRIRNWDRSVVAVPIQSLAETTIVNYQPMMTSGARSIKRALIIDQRSIRFLTGEEVADLKKIGLISDVILQKADKCTETDRIAGEHLYTNLELFSLYAEQYLRSRTDIRSDLRCLVRCQKPTPQGFPLEVCCFAAKTSGAEYEPIQRAIFCHLIAVLPSFRLRIFQECSDIYQEIGDFSDEIGSSFRYDQLKSPGYPPHVKSVQRMAEPILRDDGKDSSPSYSGR